MPSKDIEADAVDAVSPGLEKGKTAVIQPAGTQGVEQETTEGQDKEEQLPKANFGHYIVSVDNITCPLLMPRIEDIFLWKEDGLPAPHCGSHRGNGSGNCKYSPSCAGIWLMVRPYH